jgi:4'-phosphopantetheinyl transferase EntD
MVWECVKTHSVAPVQVKETLADCPLESWLTLDELIRYKTFRSHRRCADWLAGRLAAKQLLRLHIGETQNRWLLLGQIEIHNEPSGASAFRLIKTDFSVDKLSISISHSQGYAFCALAQSADTVQVGADIERVRPIPTRLLDKFLNDGEIARLHVGLLSSPIAWWALKEAALKSLRANEPLSVRDLTVSSMECIELESEIQALVTVTRQHGPITVRCWRWSDFWQAVALSRSHTSR